MILILSCILFVMILLIISFIDIRHQMIPDTLSIPMIWIGLLVNIPSLICPLPDAVIGAVAGYAVLWLMYHIYYLNTGKEGIGYGDFKLLSMMGAWLGWKALPLILLIASLSGLVFGGFRLLRRYQTLSQPIPFGPFLALGGIAMLFCSR